MKTLCTRLEDELYDNFRKHLLKQSLENGKTVSMDKYIRNLIIKDMTPTEIAPDKAPAKQSESIPTLSLGSLLDL